MGLLTFSINVSLDGCVDHQEGIADDETHAFFSCLMDEGGETAPQRRGRHALPARALTRRRIMSPNNALHSDGPRGARRAGERRR